MNHSSRMNDERRSRKGLMHDHALDNLHYHRVNVPSRIIYVEGDPNTGSEDGIDPGVDHNMAGRLIRTLDFLKGLNSKKPILIKMASPGGDWEEGLRMMDAISESSCPITVIGTKSACSMASLIPFAADRFLLTPSSQYMFHYGYGGFIGQYGEEAETMNELRHKDNDMMLRMYSCRLKEQGKFRNKSEEEIRSILKEYMRRKIHVYLSSGEAKEWGFIDGIYTGKEPLRATKINHERRDRMLAVRSAKMKFIPAQVTVAKRRKS